jgi:pyruvate/2-oxoglutarate/acetoin dehydrogenase E1 component
MATLRKSMTAALHEIMRADDQTIMLGEALDTRGGSAMITYGFLDVYGPHRVVETPISENALVGMALGAAVAGCPVIAEVYSADFLFCAGSEIINDTAKWRYQHQLRDPLRLVFRMPAGSAGNWAGPEHTQAIEGLLNNVPGLRIVIPSTPETARAALIASVNSGDPTVFLEHRKLYDVDVIEDAVGFGDILEGRVARSGDQVTIVAWGAMVPVAMAASRTLEEAGVSAEVIDPVSIKPMNYELIADSAAKTTRLIVLDEGPRTGSVSADVVVNVLERLAGEQILFERLTMPDVHHPFDPQLEAGLLPNVEDVVKAATRLVGWSNQAVPSVVSGGAQL